MRRACLVSAPRARFDSPRSKNSSCDLPDTPGACGRAHIHVRLGDAASTRRGLSCRGVLSCPLPSSAALEAFAATALQQLVAREELDASELLVPETLSGPNPDDGIEQVLAFFEPADEAFVRRQHHRAHVRSYQQRPFVVPRLVPWVAEVCDQARVVAGHTEFAGRFAFVGVPMLSFDGTRGVVCIQHAWPEGAADHQISLRRSSSEASWA